MIVRTMLADLPTVADRQTVRVGGWVHVRNGYPTLVDSTGTLPLGGYPELGGAGDGDACEIVGTTGSDGLAVVSVRTWPRTAEPTDPVTNDSATSYLRLRERDVVELFRSVGWLVTVAREYLHDHHFVELNTPVLWRSTTEYGELELEASHPLDPAGRLWLQQSPTVPAMLCAIGGVDRGFQFGRCFRTEPSASPLKAYEFTQLNLAVTFTSVEEQFRLLEGLFGALAGSAGATWPEPYPVIDHAACIARYGDDVPDYRYATIATPGLPAAAFGRTGGPMRAVVIPDCPSNAAQAIKALARRHLSDVAAFGYLTGPDEHPALWSAVVAAYGEPPVTPAAVVACPVGDRADAFVRALAAAAYRIRIGEPARFGPVWIRRQPFLDDDPATRNRTHRSKCLFGERLDGDDGPDLSDSYDLVVNGVELVSGSQNEVSPQQLLDNFAAAGVADPSGRYDYYLQALRMGAPPLHNTSIGWERLTALLLGVSMRDVMLMPKSGSGECAITRLPSRC